jgi:hypothetical protein
MLAPLSVDPLVENIVMATWGSPWRSSGHGVLRRGRFATGLGVGVHSIRVDFYTSTLGGC